MIGTPSHRRRTARNPAAGSSGPRLVALLVTFAALFGAPPPAPGQLKPYEPLSWEVFDGSTELSAHAGANAFWGQRASLTGAEGRLLEIGHFQAATRSGRIAIEIAGTVRRFFAAETSFAPPAPDVEPDADGRRADWGDYLVGTAILLTPQRTNGLAVLRFGTRLPTTDNRVGLERDQTDFYATIGGRLDRGPARATAEAGVGIHGTRDPSFEQSDVLIVALGVEAVGRSIRPRLQLLGHADGLADRTIRGSEELAELRLGVRAGGTTWLDLQLTRGLTAFSPDAGISIAIGTTR